jgi:hypothetical protein
MEVRVAYACGGDLDAHLAHLGCGKLDVGDLDGCLGIAEDDGFHAPPGLGVTVESG